MVVCEDEKTSKNLHKIIDSCRSLSYYDGRTVKTLIPQVSFISVQFINVYG